MSHVRPQPKLVAALAALLCAFALALPTTALALTTNKATARPNEDGGTGVIGGMPTRLTWEGTVEDGEAVSQVTLELPAGASFEGSSAKVTVLDGLTRIPANAVATPAAEALDVVFDEPVEAGSLLRLEVEGMSFPAEGGEVAVSGTYVTHGEVAPLEDSKPVKTIANTPLQATVHWLDAQPWVEAWNSNQFLGMFFKPQLLVTSFASLVPGWILCLGIVVAAYPFAIALGMVFALLKISKSRLLRAIAIVYVNVIRGTPLFLQIYIMFFGLPMIGVNINNNILGIVVMAINSSAYLAEIFRAGIQSIPKGQYEAAESLGMNHFQTMFSIIVPQTVRRVIPTVTSDFLTAYKDTSLLSSVGVMELMMFAKNLTSVSGNMTPYMAAAIYYLIVTLPLIKVVGWIENRIARSESGGGPRPKAGASAEGGEQASELSAEMGVHMEALPRERPALSGLMAPFRPSMGGSDVL